MTDSPSSSLLEARELIGTTWRQESRIFKVCDAFERHGEVYLQVQNVGGNNPWRMSHILWRRLIPPRYEQVTWTRGAEGSLRVAG